MRLLLVLAVMAGGCSGADRDARVVPVYDSSGRLTRLSYDSNADGRIDMVASMNGAALRTVEVDEDGDGQTDRWEHYDQGPDPARVEQVARRGAVIVRRESFVGGVLAGVEEDRDADGRVDRWETYVGGGLSTLELDTTGAGKPTRRLRYTGDGVAIETLD
jgi:hypothetical protein